MRRVAALISGRGSNLGALLEADLPVEWVGVISNRPAAGGLEIAAAHGIAARVIDHKQYATREAFDEALGDALEALGPDLIVQAGFMRILGPALVNRFAGRMINIHPSLLPAFTGLDTHARALRAGVRIHGCSVHFVTAELDGGPIIAQSAVPVFGDDDEASLAARVLRAEHDLLPAVVRAFAEDRLHLSAEGVVTLAGRRVESACLQSPELP